MPHIRQLNKSLSAFPLPAHLAFSQGLASDIKYNFSDSTAQAMTMAQLSQYGAADIAATALGYAPIQGDEHLREAIVNFHRNLNHHSRALTADDALSFCGAQEALSAIYQALLQAGDEIVVLTPSYPSLVSMAESMGVIVRQIALCADNHWQVNIAEFKQVVNEKTRLIVLNSPHNPTGSVIDTVLAEQVLKLAQHYQCYLLSDDVSQASNYNRLALAHGYLDYENSIVVGVMSKSFGLAGIRIGWAVTPDRALLQSLIAIKALNSICCSKLDEKLAYLALRNSHEILKSNNKIIIDNIAQFSALVARHPARLSWHPPQAGMLALVEVHKINSIRAWATKLVKTTGILTLPSELFGLQGNYFRLGLGQKSFAETLQKFECFLTESCYR